MDKVESISINKVKSVSGQSQIRIHEQSRIHIHGQGESRFIKYGIDSYPQHCFCLAYVLKSYKLDIRDFRLRVFDLLISLRAF